MINKIEALVQAYRQKQKAQVDPEKLTRYAATYHSTAMEGSTLTEKQVYNLLDLDIPASNKPFTEQQIVVDHQHALTLALTKAKEGAALTETLIREIGAAVMKNTGSAYYTALGNFDSSKGDYRLTNVFAGARRFPDSTKVPALMTALVSDINVALPEATKFQLQCELAFELHYRLVSIHPFADGNGRVSRLLMNYILTRFGLPMFYVFRSSRISYIQALEKARTTENISVFNDFMYRQYRKFLVSN
jgi:Fic family protein